MAWFTLPSVVLAALSAGSWHRHLCPEPPNGPAAQQFARPLLIRPHWEPGDACSTRLLAAQVRLQLRSLSHDHELLDCHRPLLSAGAFSPLRQSLSRGAVPGERG